MVKVKFIKRHFTGIEEGTIIEVSEDHAERLEAEGFIEKFKEEKPKATRKPRAKKVQTKEGGEVK